MKFLFIELKGINICYSIFNWNKIGIFQISQLRERKYSMTFYIM